MRPVRPGQRVGRPENHPDPKLAGECGDSIELSAYDGPARRPPKRPRSPMRSPRGTPRESGPAARPPQRILVASGAPRHRWRGVGGRGGLAGGDREAHPRILAGPRVHGRPTRATSFDRRELASFVHRDVPLSWTFTNIPMSAGWPYRARVQWTVAIADQRWRVTRSGVQQSGVRPPGERVAADVGDGHRVILRVICENRLEEGHHDDRHAQYRPCPSARGTAGPGEPGSAARAARARSSTR